MSPFFARTCSHFVTKNLLSDDSQMDHFLHNFHTDYGMEHFTVISCVSLSLILYVTIQLFRWTLRYKQASKFKGPSPLPFIGNAHLFIGGTEAIFSTISKLLKTYPSPVPIWFGSRETYFISTPEQLQVILRSDKALGRGEIIEQFTGPFLGEGLLTAPDTMWHVRRSLIQPSFHLKNLRLFVRELSAQSVITTNQMKRHLDGPAFEVLPYWTMYTLNTICVNTMGLRLSGGTEDNRYAEVLEKAMAGICERIVSPWLHPDFIFYRTKPGKNFQKAVDCFGGLTNDVIQARKKELLDRDSQSGASENKHEECKQSGATGFLDHLLKLQQRGENLSDRDLRDEVNTLMIAGFDTTAMIGSFTMLMLASHPEVQEKAYHELGEIYGEDASEELRGIPEHLARMKYIERVIKETLRLFPVSPILPQAIKSRLDIGGGDALPGGSLALLAFIGVHRNEKYWPDPLKFDPDRFLPEEVAKRLSFAYLPFSAGIRNCIGSKYAMMSMKTFIATILWRYVLKKDNIKPVEDIQLKLNLLIRPVEPISLRIESRK